MQDTWERLNPYSVLLNTEHIEPREYQIAISRRTASGRNFLVILPTGLGKTLIAAINIARVLYYGKRALLVAPTKPLSEQHYSTLLNLLKIDGNSVVLLTGKTKAKERHELETNARVIVATPQTIANDMKLGSINMSDFGLCVIDECHKAVGKYAYTYIAGECGIKGVQVLGLTASPGSDKKRIRSIIEALGIQDIEIRVTTDPDVAPYVMGRQTNIIYVNKGEKIDRILALLKPIIDAHMESLYKKGLSY
ncbi:MAG: DEAD/DEAH box helicase, partial [Candidatus Micrarchaeaceae archaeon]